MSVLRPVIALDPTIASELIRAVGGIEQLRDKFYGLFASSYHPSADEISRALERTRRARMRWRFSRRRVVRPNVATSRLAEMRSIDAELKRRHTRRSVRQHQWNSQAAILVEKYEQDPYIRNLALNALGVSHPVHGPIEGGHDREKEKPYMYYQESPANAFAKALNIPIERGPLSERAREHRANRANPRDSAIMSPSELRSFFKEIRDELSSNAGRAVDMKNTPG